MQKELEIETHDALENLCKITEPQTNCDFVTKKILLCGVIQHMNHHSFVHSDRLL
jgi:hypothetical protein